MSRKDGYQSIPTEEPTKKQNIKEMKMVSNEPEILPSIPKDLTVTVEKKHGVIIIYCPYLLTLMKLSEDFRINSSYIFTRLPFTDIKVNEFGFKRIPIKTLGTYDMTDIYFIITKDTNGIFLLRVCLIINTDYIHLENYKCREMKSNYIVFRAN